MTNLPTSFRRTPRPRGLLSKLAFEEHSHLGQVQFLRRLVRQNGADFGDVEIDLDFEGGVAELHGRPAIAKANPSVARTQASGVRGKGLPAQPVRTLAGPCGP